MEMFISPTDDIKTARIIGRIRALGDASTIYSNESSDRVVSGSFFWVVSNHVPQYRLSRSSTLDPAANPVELLDYDQTYLQEPPVIIGLRTVYVGDVGASGKLRIAIDVNQPSNPSYAAESGATIASVVWVIDNATYIAGSNTSMRIVVDVDPGYQWAQCQLTDSEGTFWIRYFKIGAHDADNLPFVYGDGGTINGSLEQGWTFTLPAFANVDEVLVNDFAACWRRREVYNGVETSLWGSSSATITNKVLSSNVATLTATNTFTVGQTVIVVGVDSTFDGTYVITSANGATFSYQKTAANVGSAAASGTAVVNANNVDFFGWLGSETNSLSGDPKYSVLTNANFEFMSIGARMARLWTEQLSFEDNDAPTKNGQIVNLSPWRAIWHFLSRYTTVADICEVNFSNHADTDFLFPVIPVPEETVQSAIVAPAAQINAMPSYAPWGPIAINRQVAYLSSAERGTLTIVGAFEAQDLLEAPRTFSALPDVSKVDSVGLYVSTVTGAVSLPAPQTRAPGYAPGEAAGTETLDNQILQPSPDMATALTELELRAGSDLNLKNTKVFLDCVFPDSYAGVQFIPSRDQLFTFSLTAVGGPNGVNRIEYTTADKWTVDTVSAGHDQRFGRFVIRVRFRLVSPIGDPGDDTTNYYVAPGTIVDPLPDLGFPAFNFEFPEVLFPDVGLLPTQVAPAQLLPPKGKALYLNGQELLTWSATQVFYERNVITLTTPTITEITPPNLGSFNVTCCIVAPNPTAIVIGAYILATDGTNSAVWYNPNIAAPFASANWTKGANHTGTFTLIRGTKTPGTVMIYSPAGASSTTTVTATFSGGGYAYTLDYGTLDGSGGNPGGCINGGTTSAADCSGSGTGPPNYSNGQVTLTLPLISTITEVAFDIKVVGYTSLSWTITVYDNGGSLLDTYSVTSAPISDGVWTHKTSGTISVPNAYSVRFNVNFCGVASVTAFLDNCAITYEDTSGTDANVAKSTDYGATVGTDVSVGDTPGTIGGFDTQRSGTVTYAALAEAVKKATTLGGAYSAFVACVGANPVCVIQPYYKRNSTTKNTTTSTPDVIIALDQADSDGGTLYWVDGATAVKTDITPVAGMVFSNANCVTTRYGKNIAVFGTVAGVRKLYYSINGGTSWTLVGSLTNPGFIRSRRNDTRPAGSPARGQLYLADEDVYYSSYWASNGIFVRNQLVAIIGLDTIW